MELYHDEKHAKTMLNELWSLTNFAERSIPINWKSGSLKNFNSCIYMLVCLLKQARLFMTWINDMSSKFNLFEAGSGIEWMWIDIYCLGCSDIIMLGVVVGYCTHV